MSDAKFGGKAGQHCAADKGGGEEETEPAAPAMNADENLCATSEQELPTGESESELKLSGPGNSPIPEPEPEPEFAIGNLEQGIGHVAPGSEPAEAESASKVQVPAPRNPREGLLRTVAPCGPTELILNLNRDSDVRASMIKLREYNSLCTLSVCWRSFGLLMLQEGCPDLRFALRCNHKLQSVKLSRILISERVAQDLMEGLSWVPELLEVTLENCEITVSSLKLISRLLRSHRSLQRLTLTGCGLNDAAAAWLGSGLAPNTSLREVDISRNPISARGMSALQAGISLATNRPPLILIFSHPTTGKQLSHLHYASQPRNSSLH